MQEGKIAVKWSVMIPTYNCAAFLGQALISVLQQDPGEEVMQIQVIDDCSTKDDPEEVVKRIGKGRVKFYRQPVNIGAIKNFNTCIALAQGELIHILHGDDWVANGFYRAIEEKSIAYPALNLFATRSFIVDESGEIDSLTKKIEALDKNPTDASFLYYINDLRTPAVVVRKSFYEKNGSFNETLVHVADWEMWSRAISKGGGIFINQPLAFYRFFTGNDTGRLSLTGENLRDYYRLLAIFKQRFTGFSEKKFKERIALTAAVQEEAFNKAGNHEAAKISRKIKYKAMHGNYVMRKCRSLISWAFHVVSR